MAVVFAASLSWFVELTLKITILICHLPNSFARPECELLDLPAAPFGINQRHPDVNGVHDFRDLHDAHGFHGVRGSHDVHGSRDVHDVHDVHGSDDVHALPFHPCLFDQLSSPGLSCPSAKQ